MGNTRIVYAANRKIGVQVLRLLRNANCIPVALLLPGDSEGDSNNQMLALTPGVPVLKDKAFRTPEGKVLLASLRPDYILSVHFPYIIPREVLEIPRIGTLNLHPAYLPFNRGWHTPSWAILEQTPYGATLHWIDVEGIDSGDVALRKELSVLPDDTAHTLYQRVLALEEELMREALPLLLEHRLPRIPQEDGGTMHRKADLKAMQRLDLDRKEKVGDVLKRLRALTTNNWKESAYFELDGVRYQVRVEIRSDTTEV